MPAHVPSILFEPIAVFHTVRTFGVRSGAVAGGSVGLGAGDKVAGAPVGLGAGTVVAVTAAGLGAGTVAVVRSVGLGAGTVVAVISVGLSAGTAVAVTSVGLSGGTAVAGDSVDQTSVAFGATCTTTAVGVGAPQAASSIAAVTKDNIERICLSIRVSLVCRLCQTARASPDRRAPWRSRPADSRS